MGATKIQSTFTAFRIYNDRSSIQDVDRLHPPWRRGTGGHHEFDSCGRTSSEDYGFNPSR